MNNYPTMLRKDRKLEQDEAKTILRNGIYGVLATVSKEGQPSATPLSYVMLDNKLYFHSASKGMKLDNILEQPKTCFTVVSKAQPIYDNDFTMLFSSVMVYGQSRLVSDLETKKQVLEALCLKYSPEYQDKIEQSVAQSINHTSIIELEIQHLTGKAKKQPEI